MVGLNISLKVTLMPLAIAAMFFTIPMIVQYNNPASFLRSAAGPLLSACSGPLDETCFQQLEVMLRVAGRNIRQRADRNWISIGNASRSEEHTSELQSLRHLV